MKHHKKISNKIPRRRLPNLSRKEQPASNEITFFSKIKNSLNLLEQPYSHQQEQSIQHFKDIMRKKYIITDRIKQLARHRSLHTSYQKLNNDKNLQKNLTQIQLINNKKIIKPKLIKLQQTQQYQIINATQLTNNSQKAYLQAQNQNIAKVSQHLQTASDIQEIQQKPPLLITKTNNFRFKGQKKPQILLEIILGKIPSSEKYQEYHKKLLEKQKLYKKKQFKFVHKSQWR